MSATVTGILLTGAHASRPASGVSAGTLFSCTTHSLIYQTTDTGATWVTWASLAGTGYTPGGTDVAVADGGTGSSTAAAARTALGLVIGTNVNAQVTVAENFLTGAVTMTNANQFYDGPSLSCVAGTYIFHGGVFVTGGVNWFAAKLWDGTTIYGTGPGVWNPTDTTGFVIPIFGYAVLGSTITVKISVAHNTTGGSIQPTAFTDNTGITNKASYLQAIRIA